MTCGPNCTNDLWGSIVQMTGTVPAYKWLVGFHCTNDCGVPFCKWLVGFNRTNDLWGSIVQMTRSVACPPDSVNWTFSWHFFSKPGKRHLNTGVRCALTFYLTYSHTHFLHLLCARMKNISMYFICWKVIQNMFKNTSYYKYISALNCKSVF